MKVFTLFVFGALALIAAGSMDVPAANISDADTPVMDAMQVDQMVVMRVQSEEMVARRWTELVLKIQQAQYNSMAATMLMKTMSLEVEEKKNYAAAPSVAESSEVSDVSELSDSEDISLLEMSKTLKKSRSLEEKGYGTLWGGYNGMEDDKSNYDQDKLNLIADFYLLFAIKVRFAQTVYKIGDIQREFWMDRAMQLGVQAAGQQLPPQIYQILYMKVFRTYLETMKQSTALQMISNWIMWLEDGLDVYGAKVDMSNTYWNSVVEDQSDDLIRDKMWAFSSYYQYAMLDVWVFYLDLYLEASLAPIFGGQSSFGSFGQQNAASLLEVEAEADPTQTESQSKSFSPTNPAAPYLFMKMFKWSYLLFQMQAAKSAQTAAYSEQLAYTKLDEGDVEASAKYRQFAQQMMSGFAQNLSQTSNLEKYLALWELYIMVAPMMAGSFAQGSMGSGSFGSL